MVLRIAVRLCAMASILALCVLSASAQGVVIQPPNTGASYDFASEVKDAWQVATFDDWTCQTTDSIIGLRWWGSYWTPPATGTFSNYSDGLLNALPGGILGFDIFISANEPASGTTPYDHPASSEIHHWWVPISSITETEAFTVTKMNGIQQKIYEYYCDLTPMDPLLVPGQKYWLGIRADFHANDRQWGWHEADAHCGAYAVQSVTGDFNSWYIPCGGHDMAFEFVVPEFGSFAALATGLTSLVAFVGRRRRQTF